MHVKSWSKITVIFLFAFISFGRISHPDRNILSWDNFGYYLYLPNYFIYHDPGMENIERIETIREQYHSSGTLYQVYKTQTGKRIIRYSMGNAVFYAPFFFAGHLLAGISGYPQDGFSQPYQLSIMYGCLLYALVSLIFARKVLLHYLDEKSASLTLILLYLGTNLLHMLAFNNGLTHGNLFMVYILLVWNTLRWHKSPRWKYAAGIGIFCGLAIITRPTEIISVFIPLLWDINKKEKWQQVWKYKLQVAAIPAIMLLAGLPQMLYWKAYAGSYIYRSYDNPGEGLDIWTPHVVPFLFSYRKGWLLYTPVMWFALVGIVWMWFKKRKWFWPVAVFAFLFVWLTASWTNWWYAGSFGSRAMVQSYGVLLLPLGIFMGGVLALKQTWQKRAILALMAALLALNLFQTWQFTRGIIHPELMTRAYYWKIFGKTTLNPEYKALLLPEIILDGPMQDTTKYREVKVFVFDFETPGQVEEHKRSFITDTVAHSGDHAYKIDTSDVFLNLVSIPYKEITTQNHAYIRITGWMYTSANPDENPLNVVRTFNYKNQPYYYSAVKITTGVHGVKQGTWSYFTQDYMTPHVRTEKDLFQAYLWLQGRQPVFVDDIRVGIWVPKK